MPKHDTPIAPLIKDIGDLALLAKIRGGLNNLKGAQLRMKVISK